MMYVSVHRSNSTLAAREIFNGWKSSGFIPIIIGTFMSVLIPQAKARNDIFSSSRLQDDYGVKVNESDIFIYQRI
jgi:hypothetical protein